MRQMYHGRVARDRRKLLGTPPQKVNSMKKLMLCVAVLAAMLGTGARAQDLSGNWQGTLKVGKDLRVIFNVYKGEKDGWRPRRSFFRSPKTTRTVRWLIGELR